MPGMDDLSIEASRAKTGCLIELKIDGSRMSFCNGALTSDREINRNARYGHVLKEVATIDWKVRGEMAIPGGNVHHLNKKENWPRAKYYLFDLFELGGKDVRSYTLTDRRTMLEEELAKKNFQHLLLPIKFDTFDEGWQYVINNAAEGVVLKLNDDVNWKCKLLKEAKLKIVGHEAGKSKGSFLIEREGIVGKVSGTSDGFLKIYQALIGAGKQVYAEIEYPFVTDAGLLFQPRLRRVGTLEDLKFS